jgi:hypothetical protein
LEISGGNPHDSQMMDAFLDWDNEPFAIVADKAYGSTKIRQQIADEGAIAVILSKSNARKPITHDKKSLRNAIHLRAQLLVQLRPHPSYSWSTILRIRRSF